MKRIAHVTLIVVFAVLASSSSRCSESDKPTKNDEPIKEQAVLAEESQTEGGNDMSSHDVDQGSPPGSRGQSSVDDQVVRGSTAFGLRLLGELRKDAEDANLFVSPLSITVALAMTYNGASGETAAAMARVLGFGERELAEINQTMADLMATLEGADSSVELSIANSLWGRKGFPFSDGFLERNQTFYDALVSTLDFDAPDAPRRINGWVSEETRGKIAKIVDQIPPEIVLYLINAIYFKGRWQFEFDPELTSDRTFYLSGAKEKDVPMMARSGEYRYMEDADLQALRLPYGEGRLAMYVFLPGPSSVLDRFLDKLDEESWSHWMSAFRSRRGDVVLPRFKIEYKSLLNSALGAMGMGIAFAPGRADFSGMTAGPAELFISQVLHKAVVEVNEEGTEAAAVTEIAIGVTAIEPVEEPFRFVAERPFFFVIRDDPTGSILFMGTVYDPLSQ